MLVEMWNKNGMTVRGTSPTVRVHLPGSVLPSFGDFSELSTFSTLPPLFSQDISSFLSLASSPSLGKDNQLIQDESLAQLMLPHTGVYISSAVIKECG